MSGPSEARALPEPPRRLYVSLAVEAAVIKVSYGLESPSGERFNLTRRYHPPHGAASFVDDLTGLVEAILNDSVIEVALGLLIKPVK